jgi:predicted acylesterase/phospholipase RssA
METELKKKHRGFVMTGGGAKGLYEAGVIHAFHLTGMEFDVITGSSIGAMNSLFYAEYLFHKSQLQQAVREDPLLAIEEMDGIVKAFHHAWLMMPDKNLIDDSDESPLGRLKNDLLHFNVSLPQLTRLLWWYTDPKRGSSRPPLWLLPSLFRLGIDLWERVGLAELWQIIREKDKDRRSELVHEALRKYLARLSMERSLIRDGEDNKIKEIFTEPISPLRPAYVTGAFPAREEPGTPLHRLVDPNRTLRDYARQGIHVRLTRANFRTGRLEISSYVTEEEFAGFLDKHAWRIKEFGPERIPLGSFRLKVPGNPVAINAALCSGRFPGVFLPYRLKDIYPESDPENELLYRLLEGWLGDARASDEIRPLITSLGNDTAAQETKWNDWKESTRIRSFFPQTHDVYVDGGAIDNTPYTAAVDFVRDSLQLRGGSPRDEALDLYVIYLETEPKVEYHEKPDPDIITVVQRTLALVNAANEKSRGNTFDTLNSFGKRAENIAQVLELVLDSYRETLKDLDPAKRSEVEGNLLKQAQEFSLSKEAFSGETQDGILDKLDQWTEKTFLSRLPLQVETIKIYPQNMPLTTLQFTERLGYKKENAIQMLAMGCYSTLDSLRTRLEKKGWESLDGHDRRALELARKWTGDLWQPPPGPEAADQTRPVWQCQRTACAFYETACPHGAEARTPASKSAGKTVDPQILAAAD